jgi:CMP-N,N'-diacetyllegionaminic acid synthase
MFEGKKILGVIPARGGSKGVPGKNIRNLCGKPLIAWTIEAARKSKYLDSFILSSDDEKIIAIAKEWGCPAPFVRPPELARDDTSSVDVVLHAINHLSGYDYVVMLQPTSPFRLPEDIDECISMCISKNADSCVSLTEPEKSPYWMYSMNPDGRMTPVLANENKLFFRRQNLPAVNVLNGAVYVALCSSLAEKKQFIDSSTLGYLMPKERSVDIDTELDFRICELIFQSNGLRCS